MNQTDSNVASVRFEDLGLSDEVMKAVRDLRYTEPTPVQAAAIPEVLAGRDLLAAAQTGTGKTAAFLLPALSTLDHVVRRGRDRKTARGRGPLMLVITPTRELAQQIEEVCLKIASRTKHIAVTVVGGLSYNPQKSALRRGCDILVATPGRLVDLMEQEACNLSEVKVLVLDEADRMLDMGFLPAVRRIVSCTPDDRQTLLFSATLDEKAVGGIADLVRDPARVEIAPVTVAADTVDQYVLPVSLEAKNALLAEVLKKEGSSRVIVFTRTKHRADACCRRLRRAGISCAPIHGNRSQSQRETALESFRKGTVDVLVATDVLSRGIDITDVRYVVNFDVPVEPTDYIHRIGRTGRAGELGWALTFVTEQDVEEFFAIESLMGRTAELYDADGLAVGERPPVVDPERVPAEKTGKKKTKRGKSTSKKKKPAARRERSGTDERSERSEKAARPARPKRSGRVRVREAAPESQPTTVDAPASGAADGAADRGNWSRHDARLARERAQAKRSGADNGAERAHRKRRQPSKGRSEAPRSRVSKPANRGERTAPAKARAEKPARRAKSRSAGSHDWRNSDLASDRRAPRGGGNEAAIRDRHVRKSKVGRGSR